MGKIRYVCLSDTHFGEEDSLLTNLVTASRDTDPLSPSPVMEHLVNCLRHLILEKEKLAEPDRPTLILNGDILEMALSTTNEAAMVFERFIELIQPKKKERLFKNIIYIPGNHDHHLWETARETQYVDFITKSVPPGNPLDIPRHTTRMFLEKKPHFVPSYFLNNLVQRHAHLKDFKINIAYPNFGLFDKDTQRCIVFHHGHYIEPLYYLMSEVKNMVFPKQKKATTIKEIEAENFAWIDFFWSAMGRSGAAGKGIEVIYEKLHDEKARKKLVKNLSKSLAEKYDLPGWGDRMETKFLEWGINFMAGKFIGTERAQTAGPLSKDADRGLNAYTAGPLLQQIMDERKNNMPREVTLVFGHTHKPFEEDRSFSGYPQWVNVYNTGGWIVESIEPQQHRGGSVVLVDDEYHTTSIRMYNETAEPGGYSVSVKNASHEGEAANPLYEKVRKYIEGDSKVWNDFSAEVARSTHRRRENLRRRINEGD
jgi:predicted phosphodiesterase